MDAAELRALQAPLKQTYRVDPRLAGVASCAEAVLDVPRLTARLSGDQSRVAGLHPATGGSGDEACSADLLLEALVACAAVTVMAVATSMNAGLTGGKVSAVGNWDARGTLGVDKSVPVGIRDISLVFELEGSLDEPTRQRLIELTERYCVILATLRKVPDIEVRVTGQR
jgi:uncharacterized OsmC-like protein